MRDHIYESISPHKILIRFFYWVYSLNFTIQFGHFSYKIKFLFVKLYVLILIIALNQQRTGGLECYLRMINSENKNTDDNELPLESSFDYNKFALGALLNTLGRLVYVRTKKALAEVGYSPEHIGVLFVVSMMPGLSQKIYADIQFQDVTTFGRFVYRLVKDGHLTTTELEDRRAKGLNITKSGLELLNTSSPIIHKVEGEILSSLGYKDQLKLYNMLDHMVSDLHSKDSASR